MSEVEEAQATTLGTPNSQAGGFWGCFLGGLEQKIFLKKNDFFVDTCARFMYKFHTGKSGRTTGYRLGGSLLVQPKRSKLQRR